jgi:hypothetical protein
MVAIREVFEDRIASRGQWPARSADLRFWKFYLKGKVYKNDPCRAEALQNDITCVIGSITVEQHQKVFHNLIM